MAGTGHSLAAGWAFKKKVQWTSNLVQSTIWQDWWFEAPIETIEVLVDASLNLAAYYQRMESLAMFLRAHDGLELSDLQMILQAREGWKKINMPMYLATVGQDLESLKTWLSAAKAKLNDLGMYLTATNGTILRDLAMYLMTTDGTVLNDLGMRLQAISAIPAFRSVTAYKISSVISEVV